MNTATLYCYLFEIVPEVNESNRIESLTIFFQTCSLIKISNMGKIYNPLTLTTPHEER
jgi:hypothetical protein